MDLSIADIEIQFEFWKAEKRKMKAEITCCQREINGILRDCGTWKFYELCKDFDKVGFELRSWWDDRGSNNLFSDIKLPLKLAS